MSGYILCQTKRAETPYYIENISTNIYSLEELCYYFYHNLYLIDRTIVNEELCSWIQEELVLPGLAAKIRPALGKFASVEDILYPVFKEINYLTYEELKVLNSRIRRLDEESPLLREKQKGDALIENGMYVHAIQVYQALLEKRNLEEAREGLTESIWHNLGCAYSYLFQMEKALECFRKAYEGSYSEEALETYLLALHSVKKPEEYQKMTVQLGAEEEVLQKVDHRLKAFSGKPSQQFSYRQADAMLEEFTREYHRNTGS